MFAAEFEPAETSSRRRSLRAPVSFDARLGRGGLCRALCKVVDVSMHGARLSTYSALVRGSTIWLTLPGVAHVAADVKWADDFLAGCQFHKALTQDQLAALIDTRPAG
jgi:hypothetical protein